MARPRGCPRLATCDTGEVKAHEQAKAWGHDPIFPPEPKPIESPDDGLNLSGLQTMQLMEGNIPDGYELVKVEDVEK